MKFKKPVSVLVVIHTPALDILLLERAQHPGFWQSVTGSQEENESLLETACREVQEETGVSNVKLEKFIGITQHTYFDKHIGKEVLKETHWYKMKASGKQHLQPQTEEDIEEIIWAGNKKINECLENSYLSIQDIIEKYRKSKKGAKR
jgi:8-oxo-dGTP pyrophosphatase MutT (NUDIX family)